MGQYNVTLASTPLIANTYVELNRHNVGPVPQTMGGITLPLDQCLVLAEILGEMSDTGSNRLQ